MIEPLAPALSADHTTWTRTTGRVVDVGQGRLIVLPFAAPVGRSRGTRYAVCFGGEEQWGARAWICVVLSLAGQAAIVPPADVALEPSELPLRLRALAPPRPRRMTRDFAAKLAAAGLDAALVPEAELAQLLLMINESATPEIRAARITAAVAVVQARNEHASRS